MGEAKRRSERGQPPCVICGEPIDVSPSEEAALLDVLVPARTLN
jgi:hypothetical protein